MKKPSPGLRKLSGMSPSGDFRMCSKLAGEEEPDAAADNHRRDADEDAAAKLGQVVDEGHHLAILCRRRGRNGWRRWLRRLGRSGQAGRQTSLECFGVCHGDRPDVRLTRRLNGRRGGRGRRRVGRDGLELCGVGWDRGRSGHRRRSRREPDRGLRQRRVEPHRLLDVHRGRAELANALGRKARFRPPAACRARGRSGRSPGQRSTPMGRVLASRTFLLVDQPWPGRRNRGPRRATSRARGSLAAHSRAAAAIRSPGSPSGPIDSAELTSAAPLIPRPTFTTRPAARKSGRSFRCWSGPRRVPRRCPRPAPRGRARGTRDPARCPGSG